MTPAERVVESMIVEPWECVREQGIVLQSARGPVPNLAEYVAGEPIRGSWWVVVAFAQVRPQLLGHNSTVNRELPSSAVPGPLLESTHDHDPAAIRQGLGHVLGLVASHVA